jgi:RNA polymerase sigma-70 factor (ECF subfamily)
MMNLLALSDSQLVQRARQGDMQAYTHLIERHQQFVYNLALRCLSLPADAEDISQEAFLRAWQALPHFQQKSSFRTWLYRIVVNLCYNRAPQLKRQLAECDEHELLEQHATPDDVGQAVEEAELRGWLQRQLELLSAHEKLLLSLRYQQELDYQEIAEIIQMPLGTVKVHLFRVKQKLKRNAQTWMNEQ